MRESVTRAARRIVVKVGTSLLAGNEGRLDYAYVRRLADAIAGERRRGREVALVSSGAIGAGLGPLGYTERPRSLRHLQAAAAVGQVLLVHAYEEALKPHGLAVGQVLLTRDGIEDRTRYLNARNTLLTLVEEGAVPVVNENDTVSVEEIRIGDNDTLAAMVSTLIEADLLIILTDVEGLCRSDPRASSCAEVIDEVEEITPGIEGLASGAIGALGRGGMATKIEAARMATAAAVGMVLAGGADPGVIGRILDGERVGTFFRPRQVPLEARKFWIAFVSARSGAVVVNEGARRALVEKKTSLLPIGIVAVTGGFAAGDTVALVTEDGKEFARGISYYASAVVERIRGHRSAELPGLLGVEYSEDEVFNRDNLVVLG